MKTCPKMRQAISEICAKHGINLQREGSHLRLDMQGFDRLSIETISARAISVAHYFEMNGDLVAEPDIVFFVTEQGDWIPVEITQSLGGWKRVAQFNEGGTKIVRYLEQQQADIAEFAETWAQNIIEQEWLEHGVKHVYEQDTRGLDEFGDVPFVAHLAGFESGWPEPTEPAPDTELIQEWMVEGGGCEATDGCWVEQDGVCPHGHPSWLLRLELI